MRKTGFVKSPKPSTIQWSCKPHRGTGRRSSELLGPSFPQRSPFVRARLDPGRGSKAIAEALGVVEEDVHATGAELIAASQYSTAKRPESGPHYQSEV